MTPVFNLSAHAAREPMRCHTITRAHAGVEVCRLRDRADDLERHARRIMALATAARAAAELVEMDLQKEPRK